MRCKQVDGFPYTLHYCVDEINRTVEVDALYHMSQNTPL